MPIDVPEDLRLTFSKLEAAAYIDLLLKRPRRAEKRYRGQLRILFDRQKRDRRRYHKGGPLHNLGISLLAQGRLEEGVKQILAAFIEDLISVGLERARGAPAFKTLLEFGIAPESLERLADPLKTLIRERGAPAQPDVLVRTEKGEILALELKFRPPAQPPLRERLLAQLPSIRARRVFVGGSYRNVALLRHIAQIVRELGFEPIFVADYPEKISDEESHEASIELLRQCRHAIFEVSFPDGHMMEIERCHDLRKRIRVLLLWQVHKHKRRGDRPTVSRMLLTQDFEKRAYQNLVELTTLISKFLKPKS
jgi:hypothetical protein